MNEEQNSKEPQNSALNIADVKRSYFDKLINWLEECRGKKAMIYVFCWMMLPCVLGVIALITGLFSIGISLLFLLLAIGVFIVMTIGLFMMLILAK